MYPRSLHAIKNGVSVKTCHTCHQQCPLDEFTKDRSRWDGLDKKCRRCKKKLGLQRRADLKKKLINLG